MKTLLAIAAIFVLTGLGWFAWLNIDQEGYNSGILDNPPVIKAVDKNKIKYKPEDPGGREVLNQDRSIFDRGSNVSEDIVERLLPPPEVPLETVLLRNKRESSLQTKKNLDKQKNKVFQSNVSPEEHRTLGREGSDVPIKKLHSTSKRERLESSELKMKTSSAEGTRSKPGVQSKLDVSKHNFPGNKTWKLQLGSLAKEKDAQSLWVKINNSNRDILKDLSYQVKAVELSNGTFYRLQVGPILTISVAKSLCSRLKARRQDCFVVGP
ncbi:MAG: SPOR domain-containing protein [Alphaproteobacteria bacterium]|nr:SPOR domain-containing protein [Alphaproteobacteria bacterium]